MKITNNLIEEFWSQRDIEAKGNYWLTLPEVNELLQVEASKNDCHPDPTFPRLMDYFGELCAGNYSECGAGIKLSPEVNAPYDSELPECEAHFRFVNGRLHTRMRGHFEEAVRVCRIAEYILVFADVITDKRGKTIFTAAEMVRAYGIKSYGMHLTRTVDALNVLQRYEELMIPRFKYEEIWYYDLGYAASSKEERQKRQMQFDRKKPAELGKMVSTAFPLVFVRQNNPLDQKISRGRGYS